MTQKADPVRIVDDAGSPMGAQADAASVYGAASMIAAVKGLGVAVRATVVTPSDDTVLTAVRGLWVGGAGDVAVLLIGDTVAVTFVGVQAGTVLPLAVQKIMSTNTTATSIVALY